MVLLGPPGAGKGTQAQILKEQLNVRHISSGDLFRYHLRQGTDLGRRAGEYVNQGLLVPDEITIGIILDQVLGLDPQEGFLLDGFPRTTEQAQALEEALAKSSHQLDKVVCINVPEDELVRRLGGRFICRECQTPHTALTDQPNARCSNCGGELYQREDDRPESIRLRLQVYQSETIPLLDFYRKRGTLLEIDGTGSVDQVKQRVLSALV